MTGDDIRQQGSVEQSRVEVPSREKELAELCTRFADLCQYFSQHNMDLPRQIIDEARLVSKLALDDRIKRVKRLNQELLEYLDDVGPGSKLQH